jgi:hypothetical protein
VALLVLRDSDGAARGGAQRAAKEPHSLAWLVASAIGLTTTAVALLAIAFDQRLELGIGMHDTMLLVFTSSSASSPLAADAPTSCRLVHLVLFAVFAFMVVGRESRPCRPPPFAQERHSNQAYRP